MSQSDQIFNYCVGALALATTITSILLYCRLYLPTSQLRILDELLAETKSICQKTEAEGLLPPRASRYAQTQLNLYDEETDKLREVTYNALSLTDILRAFFRGQPRKIMRLAHEVKKLRAFLMTTSQLEKARLAERRQQSLVPSRLRPDQPVYPSLSSIHSDELPNDLDQLSVDEVLTTTPEPVPSLAQLLDAINAPSFSINEPEEFQAQPSFCSHASSSSMTSTLVNDPDCTTRWRSQAWAVFGGWSLQWQSKPNAEPGLPCHDSAAALQV